MMDRSDLFKTVQKHFDVEPDYPWEKFPDYAVFRHHGSRKWFGLVMGVSGDKLGLTTADHIDILDVKVGLEHIDFLREKDGILPAYHMNKEHWVSVVLKGHHTDEEILELLRDSFDLTKSS